MNSKLNMSKGSLSGSLNLPLIAHLYYTTVAKGHLSVASDLSIKMNEPDHVTHIV